MIRSFATGEAEDVSPVHSEPVVVTQRPQVVLRSSSAPGVVVDVAVEGATIVLTMVGDAGRVVGAATRPVVGVLLRPPLVARRLQPATWLDVLARKGHQRRHEVEWELSRLLDRLVPVIVQKLLDRVDLNQVVLERVDLDGIIAAVDLPEIIRSSTGSVTSETVRGVRLRSMSADDAIARAVSRLRVRRQPSPPDGDQP